VQGSRVYIVTNRRDGTLYIGVARGIVRRAGERRLGLVKGFTQHYGLKRHAYVERHADFRSAIRREKTLKSCPRTRKMRLIHKRNPDLVDLYDRFA